MSEKENRGALWGNKDKQGETHPDFKGSINIGGTEYWLSAWKRKPDANPKAPALSLSVQPKENQQARDYTEKDDPLIDGGFEDLPF